MRKWVVETPDSAQKPRNGQFIERYMQIVYSRTYIALRGDSEV